MQEWIVKMHQCQQIISNVAAGAMAYRTEGNSNNKSDYATTLK